MNALGQQGIIYGYFAVTLSYLSFFQNKPLLQKIECSEPGCDKQFLNVYNLKLHILKHQKKFKFYCDLCGQGFMNKNHLRTHCNTHTDTRTHVCGNCSKAFVSKSSLTCHVKTCNVLNNAVQCITCGKMFKSHQTLSKHLVSIHKKKM